MTVSQVDSDGYNQYSVPTILLDEVTMINNLLCKNREANANPLNCSLLSLKTTCLMWVAFGFTFEKVLWAAIKKMQKSTTAIKECFTR